MITLETYKKFFSAEARYNFSNWIAVSVAIIILLWFMFTTIIIGLLHHVGLYRVENLANWGTLIFALLLSLYVFAVTSFHRVYWMVVMVLLFFNWWGAFNVNNPCNFVSSVTLSILMFLTFLNIIHKLLGKTLPVACPNCSNVIRHKHEVTYHREMIYPGKMILKIDLKEDFFCPSCGYTMGIYCELRE